MQLTLTDPDPQRAAHTLNAIASAYVAKTRDLTGDKKSVLDSAVAPTLPFKNSAAQLFGVSLLIGIVKIQTSNVGRHFTDFGPFVRFKAHLTLTSPAALR